MKDIKEIIVYTDGDSNDISTWSNVPYFFTKELEKRNIKIDRVNIHIDKNDDLLTFINFYFFKLKRIVINLIFKTKTKYKFQYSSFYQKRIEKIIEESIQKYSNADLQVMFSLFYSIKDSKIPFIMFGDWTIDYRLQNRQKRKSLKIEQEIINRQYESLNNSNGVISLMPRSCEMIKNKINSNVYYFGVGINSVIDYKTNENKYKSNEILFSGRKKEYLDGLVRLINVVNYCNDVNGRNYQINVIGMNKNDVVNCDTKYCNFYGYLRKDNDEQCRKYYELINNSKMLANINKGWNGISTLIEALFHGTPLIISKNIEVNSAIGEDSNYCLFVEDNENIEAIAKKIDYFMMMDEEEYKKVSLSANYSTKDHSWSSIVDKFITTFSSLL